MSSLNRLFEHLPDEIFKPLASSNRRVYARLLQDLIKGGLFDVAGDTPSKTAVLHEIGEFLRRDGLDLFVLDPDEEFSLTKEERADGDPRRHVVYRRLVETGWLVEHRDRYRRLVDFEPDARLLLQSLLDIASGESRSYGGAVLNVLGSLEAAQAQPLERAESLRNAARFSRSFVQHLRTLTAATRAVEERIVSQETVTGAFREFFGDFVEKHLISDYKLLKSNNNPFRFRTDIVRIAWDVYESDLTLARLCDGYVRAGLAKDAASARETIVSEIDTIIRVFESVDSHLSVIDEATSRIERRIATAVRYMDRAESGRLDFIEAAMSALAASGLAEDDLVEPVPPLLPYGLPIGQAHLHQPRKPPRKVGRTRARIEPPDPVMDFYVQAKALFQERLHVDEASLSAYLQRQTAGRRETPAADFAVESLDDCFAFMTVPMTPHLFGGRLADVWRVEPRSGRTVNDWVETPDFVVRRRDIEDEEAAQ